MSVFTAFSRPACLSYSREQFHRICRVSRQPLLGGGAHLAAAPDARGSRIFGYSNEPRPRCHGSRSATPTAVIKNKKSPHLRERPPRWRGLGLRPKSWAPWPTPQVRAWHRLSMSFVLEGSWAKECSPLLVGQGVQDRVSNKS